MENGSYITRQWKVTLYQTELHGSKKRILTVIGSFVDVFIKIKNILDSEYYTTFIIEEV